ncbi:MAG: hypothetical protein EXR72_03655 [Myxococcales bacterium]|nr:hypothetical protein [Myxococcales bacterium]
MRWALRSLVPRFEEPITREFYRFTARIRAGTVAALLLLNLVVVLSLDSFSFDRRVFTIAEVANVALLATDLALAVVLWRGRLSLAALRRLNIVCLAPEVASLLLNLWVFGSVSSHILITAALIVLLYRVCFDFATGLTAFGAMLLG